jgi:chemotaxis signal transduction protein
LARKPESDSSMGLSLVLFVRGGVTYGVRPEEVEGAGRLKDFTPVPGAPPYVVGAVQFRSRVISLIDLMVFWGLEMRGVADLPLYIVLGTRGEGGASSVARVGLMIEELEGLAEVGRQLDPYQAEPRSGVTHVGRRDNKALVILSAAALMRDPRLLPSTTVGPA